MSLLLILAIVLLALAPASWASGSEERRQMEAAQVQIKKLRKQEHKSSTVINFWSNKGHWALHTKYRKCWQVTGTKRRRVCSHARRSLAHHTRRLSNVRREIRALLPWAGDVQRTYVYRQCLIDHESRMAPPIYKAENGGTRGVEGPLYSDASGAYQFLDSTWVRMTQLAEAHYKAEISNTGHAADAPPWAQDVVAAFAIVRYGASDWVWNC